MGSEHATADALRRVLTARDDAGRPVFAPEQVAHLVPFVLLAGAGGVRGAELPERVATYLGALAAALGLAPGASPDAIADAAGAYYARYPVHPALRAEVEAALRDPTRGTVDWDGGARALVALLGEPAAAGWLPSPGEERERVPAGPFAQSALSKVAPTGARSTSREPGRRGRGGRRGAAAHAALDAVILDLGNVLAFHDNAKLFAELARAFDTAPEALRERLDDELWARVNRGQLPGDALRAEVVRRLGRPLSPEVWVELWSCHFTINTPMVEAVSALVGRVKLVLLSNTHDQHVAWLRPRLPVLAAFDAQVLSCDVGHVKPERAIYEVALAAAGTAPERTLFFDDVERYATAAMAVGMHGRVFTTVERFAADLATFGLEL